MFKKIVLFFAFSFCVICRASDPEVLCPLDTVSKSNDLKDLVWNRYTTENFTILSIENYQGKWLNSNIENIKNWCLKRWGIPNFKFKKECRIMVVPNKDLLKKLFNITESRYEIRKSKDDLEILAVWIVIASDGDLLDTVPYFVTTCSLIEFNYINNYKNNFCLINGMSKLNESLTKIKKTKDYKFDLDVKTKNLFSISDDNIKKMKQEEKIDFDSKSLILCLMLKKEFGENKFLRFFMSNKNTEDSIGYIYRFTPDNFDKSYNTYCKDLLNELEKNKVPDSYLDVLKK